MEEIEELRRLLREEQRLREEEQRQREEERKVEQRRLEEAEELAKTSLPLPLQQYLEACHSLDLAVDVVTDRSLRTQGDTTNPTGRTFPRRIVPWEDFPARQQEIWERLSVSPNFSSQSVFPSQHHCHMSNQSSNQSVAKLACGISSAMWSRTLFRSWLTRPLRIKSCEIAWLKGIRDL